jgi:hypothetical protein
MFRQCRRVHTVYETLEFPGSNRCANPLEFCAASSAGARLLSPNLLSLSTFISHIRVIVTMNTKMILAAIALSLSLAACAKKEEAAAPAEAPPAAEAPAPDAGAAASDAAGAASDAAAPAADAAAPAEQPPAQPQQQ